MRQNDHLDACDVHHEAELILCLIIGYISAVPAVVRLAASNVISAKPAYVMTSYNPCHLPGTHFRYFHRQLSVKKKSLIFLHHPNHVIFIITTKYRHDTTSR